MGVAIAKGILKTLGIAYKAPAAPAAPAVPATKKTYNIQLGSFATKTDAEDVLRAFQKAVKKKK